MGKKYKNPPIREAVCEFRFPKEKRWDLTIPGLFYNEIKEVFPLKERKLSHLLHVTPGGQRPAYTFDIEEKAIFLAKDRKIFVQLGLNEPVLSVHHLSPYTSWENFSEKIKMVFECLNDLVKADMLVRIGLRYINQIEIPKDDFDIAKYFNLSPVVNDIPFEQFTSFFLGVDIGYEDTDCICRTQFTTTVPRRDDCVAYILDFDYFNNPQTSVPAENVAEWIEAAHSRIEEIFEKCIKDALRDRFMEGI